MIHSFANFNAVNEAHYADVLGKGFESFITKYRELVKKKKIKTTGLYVQFSNHKDNKLDRTAYSSPDHHDPVGNYAYPLDYVLKHPADIWYGAAAKNVRILRDKSNSKLLLTSIRDEENLMQCLYRIGFTEKESYSLIRLGRRKLGDKFTGTTKYGKLFFCIIQNDLEQDTHRTQQEQTSLLLSYYDAIEDNSKKIALAIINDREPEQICFLKRSAFEVIDVYKLHGSPKDDIISTDVPFRKLASMIATIMGDKLLGQPYQDMFWTVKGRRIELSTLIDSSYIDKIKFGQKNHRHDVDYTSRSTRVVIESEYGLLRSSFSSTHDFSFINNYLATQWKGKVGEGANSRWVPENEKIYKEKLEAKRTEQFDKEYQNSLAEKKRLIPDFRSTIAKWNSVADTKFNIIDNEEYLCVVLMDVEFLTKRVTMMRGDMPKVQDVIDKKRHSIKILNKNQEPILKQYRLSFVDFFDGLIKQFPYVGAHTVPNFWKATDKDE